LERWWLCAVETPEKEALREGDEEENEEDLGDVEDVGP
jgi:hypothetical protein